MGMPRASRGDRVGPIQVQYSQEAMMNGWPCVAGGLSSSTPTNQGHYPPQLPAHTGPEQGKPSSWTPPTFPLPVPENKQLLATTCYAPLLVGSYEPGVKPQ